MAEFATLTEAATAWLTSGLRPVEEQSNGAGWPLQDVSVKFTWKGKDYEVGVRRLPE